MIDVAYAHQAPYTPYSNRTYLYDRFYYVRLRTWVRYSILPSTVTPLEKPQCVY